nr:helix-turn-helix domain-containing protein [Methylobacterium sp. ap11]
MNAAQCRAARSLLNWTQPQLAEAAGVGLSTVVDFEKERRAVSSDAMGKLATALEAAGVALIAEGSTSTGGGPGVRLRDRGEEV